MNRIGWYIPGVLLWLATGSPLLWSSCPEPVERRAAPDAESGNVRLSASTPASSISTFALGQRVTLEFSVEGQPPDDEPLALKLHFVDETGRTVKRQELVIHPDKGGRWKAQLTAPSQRMGFWRVYVSLSNGQTLPREGLRQRGGYLTYAVVPDPARRTLYSERETFFGMNGLFSRQANVMPYLGLRWMYEPSTIAVRQYGYAWGQLEPDYPGQFADDRAAARAEKRTYPLNLFIHNSAYFVDGVRKPWKVYSLPTLFYAPPKWAVLPGTARGAHGHLKPEAEGAWRNYCIQVAQAYREQYPDRVENIYQITWEPQDASGDERLIRTYQIAYQALHEADPKAVVIGPACSTTMLSRAWDARLLGKGLGKYLDGYSIHHYLSKIPNDPGDLSSTPEQNGMIEGLRSVASLVRKQTGRQLPLFATELGFNDDGDPGQELLQAQAHVRSSLILLGEGYRFHMPFSTYLPGYGFYDSLQGGSYFPTRAAPKAVVPAYAAMTFLLEGHKSTGPIVNLGSRAWGYTYRRGEETVRALWSETTRPMRLPVDQPQVEVFDWMGNGTKIATPQGVVEVRIGPNPIYVRSVTGSPND